MNANAFVALLPCLLWIFLALNAFGDERQPSVRVTGEVTVTAAPDQAQIDIGVVTQGQTAQAAATENAQQLDKVLAQLRKTLRPAANIKTTSYSLNPNYRYPKEGGKPTITGYTVANTVQAKTQKLSEVGKLIDLAMQSGANNIQRLLFTLQDELALKSKALGDAAINAKAHAEALAAALGLKIVRMRSVAEGEPVVVRPVSNVMMAARAEYGAPTPVEPGIIDVRATVTLTVEVAQ